MRTYVILPGIYGTCIHSQIEETLMHFFLRNIAATNSHTRHLILGINRYNLTRNREISSFMNFLHKSLLRNRYYTTLSSHLFQ